MHKKLENVVEEIENIRETPNPVKRAWIEASKRIGLDKAEPIVEFGLMMAQFPDLIKSHNLYHNHLHAADVVTSASFLVKEEFKGEELKKNGPLLLFSMLCHDISHSGGNNEFDFQLEREAVKSMNDYVLNHSEMISFWNNRVKEKFGDWIDFSSKVEAIILGTDFKNGPKINLENYKNNNSDLSRLKLLANEADILPSCMSALGPKLGIELGLEQKNPKVGSWVGREFFMKELAKFGSDASYNLGVQEHIESQLSVIIKYGASKLDEDSRDGKFMYVAENIHYQANSVLKSKFDFRLALSLRDMFLNGSLAGLKNTLR
jgi:hypothetical protein